MNKRRVIGIFIAIAGIILIVISLYIRSQQQQARHKVSKTTSLFSGSSYGKQAGDVLSGAAESKIGQYNAPALWSMIGGVVLVILGAGVAICCGNKKRK